MMWGLNDDTLTNLDDTVAKEEENDIEQRKSSMDAILGPMSRMRKTSDLLINTRSSGTDKTPSRLISVNKLNSPEEYDRIMESDDESRSSYRDSFNISLTSS